MRVLIVEDNVFNAFCLSRLLTVVDKQVQITIIQDSVEALNLIQESDFSFVVLDGNLGATDGLQCNGPTLADVIWQLKPNLPIVAWTDSEVMRHAFFEVFNRHNKLLNEYNCWTKVVSQERIHQSIAHLMIEKKSCFNGAVDSYFMEKRRR